MGDGRLDDRANRVGKEVRAATTLTLPLISPTSLSYSRSSALFQPCRLRLTLHTTLPYQSRLISLIREEAARQADRKFNS